MISTWLYPQHKYIQGCREENNALDLKGKHVLVVGGTQGIGAGLLPQSPFSVPASICLHGADLVAVARRFAGLHCKVSVAGRSEKRGRSVLWEANLANPGPLGKFYKVDLSSMKEVERFTDEVTRDTKGKGIDYLILCAGGPPIGRWRGPTSEVPFPCEWGIDSRDWRRGLRCSVFLGTGLSKEGLIVGFIRRIGYCR